MATSEEFAKEFGDVLITDWVTRKRIVEFLGGNKGGARQAVTAFAAAKGLVAEKVFHNSHRPGEPVQYHCRPPALGETPGKLVIARPWGEDDGDDN